MIGTYLQCFVSPHKDSHEVAFFVSHDFDIPCSTFLPLWRLRRVVKAEKFGTTKIIRETKNLLIMRVAISDLMVDRSKRFLYVI